MLSVENSKIEDRKLILLARFSADFTRDKLVPEIEANCNKYPVEPWLIENFQRYKFARNSLYFHHAHAYADIPVKQEYEFIASMSMGSILPGSIMKCKTTVLAFFFGLQNAAFTQCKSWSS